MIDFIHKKKLQILENKRDRERFQKELKSCCKRNKPESNILKLTADRGLEQGLLL